ncbi:MAG: zinc ribbon domain-containing protein [Lentisphaeria bacterium]
MPIYEYKCEECGHLFERLAKNSEDHPGKCPKCGRPKPVKQFSSFAPAMGGGGGNEACPSAGACPTGDCCSGGSCPF